MALYTLTRVIQFTFLVWLFVAAYGEMDGCGRINMWAGNIVLFVVISVVQLLTFPIYLGEGGLARVAVGLAVWLVGRKQEAAACTDPGADPRPVCDPPCCLNHTRRAQAQRCRSQAHAVERGRQPAAHGQRHRATVRGEAAVDRCRAAGDKTCPRPDCWVPCSARLPDRRRFRLPTPRCRSLSLSKGAQSQRGADIADVVASLPAVDEEGGEAGAGAANGARSAKDLESAGSAAKSLD